MDAAEQIKNLTFFNEKAARLERSSFTQIVSNQKTGISISWNADEMQELQIQRLGPNEDSVDAFVLTFRLFIQDNERTSFRKMAVLYEEINVAEELKDRFRKARKELNEFLDSNSMVRFNDTNLTNRHILDTFIYGGLSHANEIKKEEYDNWMASPFLNPLLQNEFLYVLSKVFRVVYYVRDLNNEVLKTLLLSSEEPHKRSLGTA